MYPFVQRLPPRVAQRHTRGTKDMECLQGRRIVCAKRNAESITCVMQGCQPVVVLHGYDA
jgi:hypothetical protein